MTERVRVDIQERIVHVRLNRPGKRNALDADMFDGLLGAARRLAEDPSVRAVVLSGEGASSSSGLDFSSFSDMAAGNLDVDSESDRETARDLSRDGANRAQQLGWLWQELPVPVIARLQKREPEFLDPEADEST